MKRLSALIAELIFLLFCFSGCMTIGEKTASISVVYAVCAIAALIMLIVYFVSIKKKEVWYLLLFSSVFVVNSGYFLLSVSDTLNEALAANRFSYLGSVFLPMSMLMIVLKVLKFNFKRYVPVFLVCVGFAVFLIAATPGYSDIYYKEVSLVIVDGVSALNKVYGPLHIVYLIYLVGYFLSMVIAIIINAVKKKANGLIAVIIGAAVFMNIGVWLLEQFVRIDFEILSVSYIITELFLICMCLLTQDGVKQVLPSEKSVLTENEITVNENTQVENSQCIKPSEEDEAAVEFFNSDEYKSFINGLKMLTNTENKVYNCYIEGKSTKEILTLLNITENTLKYHNKNLYGKLGVSSRKQLREIASKINEYN